MKQALARVPGALVVGRIGRNLLEGARQRLRLGSYTADGTTHRYRDVAESVAYIREVLEDYQQFGRLGPDALLGKDIVEIGPGDSLGLALLLVGAGARSVVCVDRFEPLRDPVKERAILAALVASAAPEERPRMLACLDACGLVGGGAIRYCPGVAIEDAAERLGNGCCDLVVSRVVLQSVTSIDQAYAACRRLLRPAGRMLHKVDLGNLSARERHPLQFLKYGPRLWQLMSSNLSRTNRQRWPHHRDAMLRHGFAVQRFEATRLLPLDAVREYRGRLARPFRALSDEDLAVYGFFVDCLRA
jgi:SAM-dependent methyltransferase